LTSTLQAECILLRLFITLTSAADIYKACIIFSSKAGSLRSYVAPGLVSDYCSYALQTSSFILGEMLASWFI